MLKSTKNGQCAMNNCKYFLQSLEFQAPAYQHYSLTSKGGISQYIYQECKRLHKSTHTHKYTATPQNSTQHFTYTNEQRHRNDTQIMSSLLQNSEKANSYGHSQLSQECRHTRSLYSMSDAIY